MRLALPGSALVHAGVLAFALLGFAWPQPEDAPAPGDVTVDIISVSSVSANASDLLEASAAETLVSAGGEPVQAGTSSPIEPLEPADSIEPVEAPVVEPPPDQPAEPVEAEPVEPAKPAEAESVEPAEPLDAESSTETAEPIAAETAQPVDEPPKTATSDQPMLLAAIAPISDPVEAVPLQAAEPVQAEAIEPVATEEWEPAPMPQTLTKPRPSEPTVFEQPKPKPKPQQAPQQKPTQTKQGQPKPNQAGNGGNNVADAVAAPSAGQGGNNGGGGTADTAKWEKQVLRRLSGALRYPPAAKGAKGEVLVRFTVAANGAVSGVRVIRSSGNPVLDQAALDTVARAAPFPPIPAGAGFSSKTFDFPLGFVR